MNLIDYICAESTPRHIKLSFLDNHDLMSLSMTSEQAERLMDVMVETEYEHRITFDYFVKYNIPYSPKFEAFWDFRDESYHKVEYLLKQIPRIEELDDNFFGCLYTICEFSVDIIEKCYPSLPCEFLVNAWQKQIKARGGDIPCWNEAEYRIASVLLPDVVWPDLSESKMPYIAFNMYSEIFNDILENTRHPLFPRAIELARAHPEMASPYTLSRNLMLDASLSSIENEHNIQKIIEALMRGNNDYSVTIMNTLPSQSQMRILQKLENNPSFIECALSQLIDEYHIKDINITGVADIFYAIHRSYALTAWLKNIPKSIPEFLHYVHFLNTEVRSLIDTLERTTSSLESLNITVNPKEEHDKLRASYDSCGYNNLKNTMEEHLIF